MAGWAELLGVASNNHGVFDRDEATAVQFHGLRAFDSSRCFDVTVRRSRCRADIRVHRYPDVAACDVRLVDGIRVTSPARTVVDLAVFDMPNLVRRTIDEWSGRRILTIAGVVAVFERVARSGRPGIQLVRAALRSRALVLADVDGRAEARLADLLVAHGLPTPTHHHLLRVDGIVVAELDLAYPSRRIAIEVLGPKYHGQPDAVGPDAARRNQILRAGWRLRQFVPADIDRRPLAVVEEVRAVVREPIR